MKLNASAARLVSRNKYFLPCVPFVRGHHRQGQSLFFGPLLTIQPKPWSGRGPTFGFAGYLLDLCQMWGLVLYSPRPPSASLLFSLLCYSMRTALKCHASPCCHLAMWKYKRRGGKIRANVIEVKCCHRNSEWPFVELKKWERCFSLYIGQKSEWEVESWDYFHLSLFWGIF